jgi:farnesyl diphosphate synthase
MSATPLQFAEWTLAMQARVEQVLTEHMPVETNTPHRLHQAMRYAVLGGGKRVRALLAYAAGEFCGARLDDIDMPAAAVELIHAFSLVHDDMPCMDDDDLRRGKPSTHKQFGDATALLAGDALQSLAFELISGAQSAIQPSQQVSILHCLAVATGSRGMAGGQSIDLESTGIKLTQSQLAQMHALKTGALIQAAAMMGAYSADKLDSDKITAIATFSKSIGLAFQVVDDILDAEADTATLGKTAGKDAEQDKSTYVTLLGVETAKTLAQSLYKQAIAPLEGYGREADRLISLANFITQRQF